MVLTVVDWLHKKCIIFLFGSTISLHLAIRGLIFKVTNENNENDSKSTISLFHDFYIHNLAMNKFNDAFNFRYWLTLIFENLKSKCTTA